MDVQTKRVAHTMWEKGRAYTRREYYVLLRLGPEDAESLEAAHEGAVTKELYSVPVQTGLERFEGGLGEVRVSMQKTPTWRKIPFASQGRAHRLRGPRG